MQTALETLSILPDTKDQVEIFKSMLKKEILSCPYPLQVLVHLKRYEKTFGDLLKDDDLDTCYLASFKNEAKDNKLTVEGASLTSQEFGGTYDFSHDMEWVKLDKQIKTLSEIKKGREKQLQVVVPKINGKLKIAVKL
jgi:hypothetical protein